MRGRVRYTIEPRKTRRDSDAEAPAIRVYEIIESEEQTPPSPTSAEASWIDNAGKWWLAKALAIPGVLLTLFPILLSASREFGWGRLFPSFCTFLVAVVTLPVLVVAARQRASGLLRIAVGAVGIMAGLLLLSLIPTLVDQPAPGVGGWPRWVYTAGVSAWILATGGLLVAAPADWSGSATWRGAWAAWLSSMRRRESSYFVVAATLIAAVAGYQVAGTGEAMRGLYRVATLQDQVDTLREIVARELSGEDALRGGDNWFTSAEEVRNSLQEANAQLLNSIRTPDSLRTAIRDDSLWSRDSANLGGLLQALGKERIDALIDPPPTLDSTLLDLAARVRARRRAWDRTFAASAQTGPWHPIPPGDSLRFADDVDMRLARARREAASRREGLVAKTTIAERGRIVALALVSDFVQKELAARVNWIRKVALAFFLGGIAVLVAGLYRLERRHDLVVEASQRKIEKLEIAAEQVADEEPRDGEPHSVRKQIGELWREIEVEKDRVGREASRTAERRIGLKFGIAMLVLFAIPLAPRLEPEEIDLSGRFMPFSLSPWYAPSALPALVGRDARPTRRASTTDLMLGVGRIPPWSADSIAERVAARLASRDESFRQEVAGRLRLIDTVQAMIAADMSDRIANVSRALRSLPPPPPASEATP